jgi:alpha-tubulin suppressor-like RCC1 family protein
MDFPAPQRTGGGRRRCWTATLVTIASAFLLATAGSAAAATGADSWGNDEEGALGNGKESGNQLIPGPVLEGPGVGLSNVKQVAGGQNFGLALLNNGTVKAWGMNTVGQLGNGTIKEHSPVTVPVEVKELKGVKAIAAGESFGLALLENGTVMAWGEDEFGALCNKTKGEGVFSDVPVKVEGLTEEVTEIAAGGLSSYFLMKGGTEKACGFNEFGQLGNGSTTSADEPVAVSGLSGLKAISGGQQFALALLGSGKVDAWGSEEFGQLGNGVSGEKKQSDTPVEVKGLTKSATAISAGGFHSLALLEGGTAEAWGDNDMGQVGNGTTTSPVTEAVAVKELSGVKSVAAGDVHSLALLTTGLVEAWGDNAFGELGNGTTTNSDVPVAVKELGEVSGIAGGSFFSLSTGAPDPIVSKIEPKTGPEAGGTTVTVTGASFTGATAVRFGATNAKEFKVNSETSITAVSPAGTGSVNVTVLTPGSGSPIVPADTFNYRPAGLKPTEWKVNGTKLSTSHSPIIQWGTLTFENTNAIVGKVTCQILGGGGIWNEGEAGFESLEAFATSPCTKEAGNTCPGAFLTSELPLKIGEREGTEKEKIAFAKRTSSLPWNAELIEGENVAKTGKVVKVKTQNIKMSLVLPCQGLELLMEGTLEPIAENGAKNGLHPSHVLLEGKGGVTGHLTSIELELVKEGSIYVSGEIKDVGNGAQQLISAE